MWGALFEMTKVMPGYCFTARKPSASHIQSIHELCMLKCSILIRRIGRHGLATVPHFYNLVTVEAEQMHGLNPCLARTQYDVGVHGYQIAITEHVLDRELLVRQLEVILDHGLL